MHIQLFCLDSLTANEVRNQKMIWIKLIPHLKTSDYNMSLSIISYQTLYLNSTITTLCNSLYFIMYYIIIIML